MVNFLMGDLLTRVNNGHRAFLSYVDVNYSFFCMQVLVFLYCEGYISGFSVLSKFKVRIFLKYLKNKPLFYFKLVSTPGKRIYVPYKNLIKFSQFGVCVLSTSKGILSSNLASYLKIGGEVLFLIKSI